MDKTKNWSMDLREIFGEKKARVTVEEKRRSVGFGEIHCFGSSLGRKARYGNYHKSYFFIGW